MLNFEFCSPTEFVFGKGTENQVGELVKKYGGTNVLVHFGGGSAVRSGLIDRVKASLEKANLRYELLGGAQPNPRDGKVYEGIALIREKGIDFVLPVGGGSAIDSAKAMAMGALYDGDFWDLYSDKAEPKAILKLGVILTMAAAGSEASNSSVITQERTLTKHGLSSELSRPLFAVMNPELTATLPPYQTACGVSDIMAHILERYFTNTQDVDVTDRLCEGLLLSVVRSALILAKDPTNYEARANLLWAGTLAHNNLVGVGREQDWSSHMIEHELSALYDVAHGAGLAVVFPAWMRYTLYHDVNRFAQLAVRVWGCQMDFANPDKTALMGIQRFEAFLKDIGLPITMKELGAKTEDIEKLASRVRYRDGQKLGFFQVLEKADVENIYIIADR
jgi:alcohol dehydrogenase YqhD (iron-dependent ADH family)